VAEFYKGARAIRARTGQNWVAAAVELTHRNTRRYGGYIVHMGIVFMFIGFAGAAFNQHSTVEVRMGDTFRIGRYDLRVLDLREGDNENYSWQHAVIEVRRNGEPAGTLEPERRFYKSSEQATSEVAIRRRLNEDLYLNYAGLSNEDPSKAVIQAYVFPLVSWIWIGFATLIFGSLICLIPSKIRREYPRTQVVGVAERYATVEK